MPVLLLDSVAFGIGCLRSKHCLSEPFFGVDNLSFNCLSHSVSRLNINKQAALSLPPMTCGITFQLSSYQQPLDHHPDLSAVCSNRVVRLHYTYERCRQY